MTQWSFQGVTACPGQDLSENDMNVLMMASLACGLLNAADDAETLKGDLARLQGTWKWKGQVGTEGEAQWTLVVKGDAVTMTFVKPDGVESTDTARLKLDEKARPRTLDFIDFERQPGSMSPPPAPMIYEFQGDTLRVCGGHNESSDRPTEFKTGGEGKEYSMVFVLKRQKD